ncbi:MAG: hypothetical protein V3U53_04430, partial [bacterium]
MATERGSSGVTGVGGVEEAQPGLGVVAPRSRRRLPLHKRIFEREILLGWGTIVGALLLWEAVARSGV